MKSTILVSLLVFPVLAALNGMSARSVAPAPVVVPCVALSGKDSHVEETSYLRITKLDDWVKLWRKHKGDQSKGEYSFHYDPLELPMVDFDRYMVIALFEDTDVCASGYTAEPVSETPEEIKIGIYRKAGGQTGFARPFPNEPASEPECSASEAPKGVRQTYGFFVIPISKKMIILEQREEGEMEEIFRIPALK